jgi:hypothetical protein
MVKGKQTTKEAKASLDAKLKAALEDAHAAGLAAAREFVKRAEERGEIQNGFVLDTCGSAYLKVGGPSGHFRSALERLDPEAEPWEGYWSILSFKDEEFPAAASQSIRAHEAACKAACVVMTAHFPEERFYVLSHVD